MDVRITANTMYPAPQADTEFAIVRQADDSEKLNEQSEQYQSIVREVHEKVLMDLGDVQKFLYMLIGSEIKVQSDNERIGHNVNAVA